MRTEQRRLLHAIGVSHRIAQITREIFQVKPGSLTAREAFDVAAFINSHPRPDSPGKELDVPQGGAPKDVPYSTKGHEPQRPPSSLMRRTNPRGAIVPKPPLVDGGRKPGN